MLKRLGLIESGVDQSQSMRDDIAITSRYPIGRSEKVIRNEDKVRTFFGVDCKFSLRISTSSNGPNGSSNRERMVTLLDIVVQATVISLVTKFTVTS
jgi:hypothetical protein